MTLLNLVILPDPRLKSPVTEEIHNIDSTIQKLLDDMLETMYKEKGIGLAAVQIGAHKRLFVMDVPNDMGWEHENYDKNNEYISNGGPYCIINPKILERSKNNVVLEEGCLSIPGQRGDVTRPEAIILEYLDRDSNKMILKANKWLARCIQHEIDHLDGIVFIEHFSKLKYDLAIKKAIKIKREYYSSS